MTSNPPPPYPPYSATEFEMLASFLDYYRGVKVRKIEGPVPRVCADLRSTAVLHSAAC